MVNILLWHPFCKKPVDVRLRLLRAISVYEQVVVAFNFEILLSPK
jgi:hypothetical protein